jgi:hypothetical protein
MYVRKGRTEEGEEEERELDLVEFFFLLFCEFEKLGRDKRRKRKEVTGGRKEMTKGRKLCVYEYKYRYINI